MCLLLFLRCTFLLRFLLGFVLLVPLDEPGRPGDGRVSVPRSKAGLVTRNKKELEQLHLLVGVPAFPDTFERRYPLYVFNAILGGTMSSRLFQKIREERGLVYSVYSAVNAFLDAGFLTVYAATHPDSAAELLRLVKEELPLDLLGPSGTGAVSCRWTVK